MLRSIGKQSERICEVSPELMHMHVLCVLTDVMFYILRLYLGLYLRNLVLLYATTLLDLLTYLLLY